jgi:hypothetical protein
MSERYQLGVDGLAKKLTVSGARTQRDLTTLSRKLTPNTLCTYSLSNVMHTQKEQGQ